mmetsp:Transcript_37665/g.53120  ORF Transcript_37665/g.53120 Transcript_37665/m.53120 type:complete len:117 (-) Transcript_37665:838-1188(-)
MLSFGVVDFEAECAAALECYLTADSATLVRTAPVTQNETFFAFFIRTRSWMLFAESGSEIILIDLLFEVVHTHTPPTHQRNARPSFCVLDRMLRFLFFSEFRLVEPPLSLSTLHYL